MTKWEQLEIDCCNYLNKKYGNDRVRFEHTGRSDSSAPDIKVYIDGKHKFNIEVKSADSQSGQFVVLNNGGKFEFSSKNKSSRDEAMPFIEYMNSNYGKYSRASTSGVQLEMEQSQFNSWIIDHYLKKNEIFVITYGDKYIIFPTEEYGRYFNTTCTYRVKKSGSNDVPMSYAKEVADMFNGYDYKYVGKKLLVKTHCVFSIGDTVFLRGYNYRISEIMRDGSLYIRRLSNTYNANVIFAISLKQAQQPDDLIKFEGALK